VFSKRIMSDRGGGGSVSKKSVARTSLMDDALDVNRTIS